MDKIYDLIIIGSGPAGLSAAIYGVRAKLDLLVIEREMMSGGQVVTTYEVDNYPGLPGINGFDLAMKFREHAENLGAEFVNDSVKELIPGEDGIKRVVCEEEEYAAKTVIIASGAHHSLLGVPGEAEFSGMGVSYCATCDGAFYKNKVTAVVGGGDVALEDAIFLSRLCSKVYIIHRRNEFRGAKSLQDKLLAAPNVETVLDSIVTEVRGSQKAERLLVKNVKTGEEKELEIDGFFVAVGIEPESGIYSCVKKNEKGYIIADETCETNVPGIFAAGDVRAKQLRQIITAAADGANAVTSAERYLNSL